MTDTTFALTPDMTDAEFEAAIVETAKLAINSLNEEIAERYAKIARARTEKSRIAHRAHIAFLNSCVANQERIIARHTPAPVVEAPVAVDETIDGALINEYISQFMYQADDVRGAELNRLAIANEWERWEAADAAIAWLETSPTVAVDRLIAAGQMSLIPEPVNETGYTDTELDALLAEEAHPYDHALMSALLNDETILLQLDCPMRSETLPAAYTPALNRIYGRAQDVGIVSPFVTTSCWNHPAATNHCGYPSVQIYESPIGAHRAGWMALNGPLSPTMLVCHHCDNPKCVRPSHLFIGTKLDNTKDMLAKGRHNTSGLARGREFPAHKTHCPAGHAYEGTNLIVRASDGRRECRTCKNIGTKRRARERRAEVSMSIDAHFAAQEELQSVSQPLTAAERDMIPVSARLADNRMARGQEREIPYPEVEPFCDRCKQTVGYTLIQRDGDRSCDDCADYGRNAQEAARIVQHQEELQHAAQATSLLEIPNLRELAAWAETYICTTTGEPLGVPDSIRALLAAENATKTVPVGQDHVAVVDADDFDLVTEHGPWFYKEGYARSNQLVSKGKYRTLFMHRLIMGTTDSSIHVDHIDGDGLDNRRSNLRHCTPAQNQANRGSTATNKTGFKGVSMFEGKYRAQIRYGGANHHIGMFATAEEAARAYDRAAVEAHGEFARTNFPQLSCLTTDPSLPHTHGDPPIPDPDWVRRCMEPTHADLERRWANEPFDDDETEDEDAEWVAAPVLTAATMPEHLQPHDHDEDGYATPCREWYPGETDEPEPDEEREAE